MSLVGVAAVFAAADYGWQYLSESANSKSDLEADRELREAREIVKNVNSALLRMKSGRTGLAMLSLSEKPFTRDPLVPLPGEEGTSRPAAAGLACSGTMRINGMGFVLMGGEEYAVGDLVESTGEVVEAVEDGRVVLRNDRTGEAREIECAGVE